MRQPNPFHPFRRLLRLHALALWLFGISAIFYSNPALNAIAAGLLVSFACLSLPRFSTSIRLLCLAMGAATAWLAMTYGVGDAIFDGIARSAIFPGFLATLVLLRATAENRPETEAARQAFAAQPEEQRSGGIVIGAHVIASILQVGVFAILSPIVGRDTPEEERRRIFLVAARGMALVPFWSPFIVAMALANEYLPGVPLWQPVALGLVLTLIGIIASAMIMDRMFDLRVLWRAFTTLGPVIPGVFAAAAIVIGASTYMGWSTLQSLVIGLPLPCLIAVLLAKRAGDIIRMTRRGIARIGPETTLLSFAMTLGVVFEAAMPASGFLDWLKSQTLHPALIVFLIITGMNITGLMGIHPIVPGTVLLVIFVNVPSGLTDLVLMQSVLVGWGMCTLISMGSLMIATGSVMFDLSPTRLITPANIGYSFGLGAVCAAILAALNGFLTGQGWLATLIGLG